jgi:bifunctional UDP-N-acetylglucosamine pyrophosphorylase / glucosamine-1-phosphate N-acetyltransferase
MNNVMVIPAAGLGSRLKSSVPKLLFPVNGRPMVDYLLHLYAPVVESFIIVLSPSAVDQARNYCTRYDLDIQYAVQETPSGMLDAVLIPWERICIRRPQDIWITWCDQIAIHPQTVANLSRMSTQFPQMAVILPTIWKTKPYVHFTRDGRGAIVDVLHAREGDCMPEVGESDVGLFRLSCEAYLECLPVYAREAPRSKVTQEKNFLPFIPWLNGRAEIRTFPISNEIESVGVNDMADLQRIERHLGHGW